MARKRKQADPDAPDAGGAHPAPEAPGDNADPGGVEVEPVQPWPTEGGRYLRDSGTGHLTQLPPGAEQQRAQDAVATED